MNNGSLLPPNATAQERAIEAATARVGDIDAPVLALLNPDTCPLPLLPWLAWALSIDAWKSYWPEHIKRSVVRNALSIQRRKGTADSVRAVVQAFGGAVILREWFQQEPAGEPHTFDMVLNLSGEGGQVASASYVDDVIAEVERTKPVRSHFTFTQGAQAVGAIGVIAAARPAVYRRLQFAGV